MVSYVSTFILLLHTAGGFCLQENGAGTVPAPSYFILLCKECVVRHCDLRDLASDSNSVDRKVPYSYRGDSPPSTAARNRYPPSKRPARA